MRCKKVLDRLDDHVDGLLPSPDAEAIRDHLDLCAECRETAFALKAASASLSIWDDADMPDGCFDKILARIDALPADALARPPRRSLLPLMPRFDAADVARYRRVATGGLAAAAAVLGALVVTRTESPTMRRARPAASGINVPVRNAVGASAGFFQSPNLYFDDGLFRERDNRRTSPRLRVMDAVEASPK